MTDDDFAERARAAGRVLADEWMQKNGGPQTTGHHIAHTSIVYGFRAGAEWARDHLAAQEPSEEMVVRAAQAKALKTWAGAVESEMNASAAEGIDLGEWGRGIRSAVQQARAAATGIETGETGDPR